MELLLFLLKKRLQSFYSAGNWKGMLSVFLFSAVLIIYGVGAGYLYDMYNNRHLPLSAAMTLNSIKTMLIVLPVILKFFPSVALKKNIISAHYPISRLKIASIDFFAVCLLKAINFTLPAFIITFSLVSKNIEGHTTILLFYYWLIGFLLAENLVNALTWRKYIYLAFVIALMAGILGLVKYPGLLYVYSMPDFMVLTIVAMALIACFFAFYKKDFDVVRVFKGAVDSSTNLSSYLSLKVLWRNQKCRTAVLIALASKVSFLILFLSGTERNTLSEVLHKVPFILMLLPPIIIFTYLLNNTWGYFIDVQLNSMIANPSFNRQVSQYMQLLLPLVITDAIVAAIVFGFFKVLTLKIAAIYIVFCVYCIPLGFLSSFRKYFVVDLSFNFSRFRGKTSQFYSFLMITPAFLSGFLYDLDLYLYLYLAALLIVAVVISGYIKWSYGMHFTKLKQSFFSLKSTPA